MNAITRREFLKSSTALVIGFYVPFAGTRFANAQGAAAKTVYPPNAFLRIGKDNSVTIQVKHLEFGQGVQTALPMLVAEELECDWSKVKTELAPAQAVYGNLFWGGVQGTGGSSSVANSWDQLRIVGAQARTMLIEAAAESWKVKPADCRAEKGFILGPGGKRAPFGQFAEAAMQRPLPPLTPKDLKDPKSFKILGKPTRRLDSAEKIAGKTTFGMDVQRPNLHVALIAHPPRFGAKVKKLDATKIPQNIGVTHAVQISTGVAVVAKSYWSAKTGRDLLEVTWDGGATLSSEQLLAEYRELAKQGGVVAKKAANPEAMKGAAKVVSREYVFPFLAHAPMEPLNCTVEIRGESAELWVGSQFQTMDHLAAAKTLGLKPENVKLNTMYAGGGFGRRANPVSDYIVEACEIAKDAKVPVKVIWTREDDIRGGYYRPMYLHKVDVGLDANGKIVAWNHVIVGQSILTGTPFEGFGVKDGIDNTSVEGVPDTHYDIPNLAVSLQTTKSAVPSLWWRSVGHTHTAYVMETMIDELAAEAKKDPVAYRRELLAKHPRHLKVLELAAEKGGWGSPVPAGRARGFAIHESFGTVVAQVAEVSLVDGAPKVHAVTAAIDCGFVVNPLTVEAQVQSGIAYGLAAALTSEITVRDGAVQQSNFHDYQVLRMNDMPTVTVHAVPGGLKPSGAGEPGTPPIAPAVANALAVLTGKRATALPLTKTKWV